MPICNKTFAKECTNIAVSGFELCANCNTLRLKKQQKGICSTNAYCTNLSYEQFSWCRGVVGVTH